MTAVFATLVQVVLLGAGLLLLPAARARLRGEPLDAPVLALRRGWRKGRVVPAGSSVLWGAVPAAALAAAGVAALLSPAAALGGVLGPASDLVLAGALLAGSRALPALAAFDAGAAAATQTGLAGLMRRVGAVPVLLLVGLAAGILSGGTNMEAAALAVRDGGAAAHGAGLLAGMALLLLLPGTGVAPDPWTGRGRVLLALAGEVRLVSALFLAAALLCPYGLSPQPEAWFVGAVVALAKLLVLGAAVSLPVPGPAVLPASLPVAAVLAVGAVLLASLAVAA